MVVARGWETGVGSYGLTGGILLGMMKGVCGWTVLMVAQHCECA